MRTTGAASLVVALLTAMFAAGPAAAQEPGPISMGEAMRMALELRPTMDAAQAGVDAAQSSLARARAAQLPTVEGYWDWRTRQSLARPVDVGGGTVQSSSGRSDSRDAGVSVNLTLYDSSTRISINQARASAEAAGHRLVDTRHELMLNVARLYLTALGQEQLAEVAATAVMSAQQHLALVDASVAAGVAAEADAYPLQVQLAQAKLQAVATESALARVLADLRVTMGLPPGPPLKLSERLMQIESPGDADALLETALTQRPDVAAQQASLRASRWAVRSAKESAGLSYALTSQGDWGRHTGVTGESWSVSAGVSLPIFNGQARASVDGAEANLRSAEAQMAELELSVRREIEQQYLALAEADERITVAQTGEDSARVNLAAAEARYTEGLAIVIEVTDADQSLREAQASRVQALYDYNLAHTRLLSAVGADLLQAMGAQ